MASGAPETGKACSGVGSPARRLGRRDDSVNKGCLFNDVQVDPHGVCKSTTHTHSVSRRAFVHDGRHHNVCLSPNGQALLVPTYTYPVGCDPPKIHGGIVEGGGTAATICAIVVASLFTAKLACTSRALDVVDCGESVLRRARICSSRASWRSLRSRVSTSAT